MNKKIFLTSAAIMCMACPAIAETFPQDGNMLENKTYDNAATYTNTGVYEGDVTANAYYSTNEYNVSAGSYFTGLDNNNNATTATCTSGNYCPGVQSTTYDDVNSAFVDDGLQTCPSGYASSDLGASADTQCYRACDINNMGTSFANIAHASAVSGNDYYGAGTDTCVPTACENGWHVKPGLNLATAVGTGRGASRAYIDGIDNFTEDGASYGQSFYGITSGDANAFAVNYGNNGIIHGHGACSTTPGTANWSEPYSFSTESSITDQTGTEGAKYCWCHVDGYTPKDGTLQSVSSSWVFNSGDYGDASDCADYCANDCSNYLRNANSDGLAFRAAVLGSVGASPAMCEANTINITWNDASAEDIAATGAATTVYEGDIKTPLKAVTKPGKTFVGWKFIKPTTPVQQ